MVEIVGDGFGEIVGDDAWVIVDASAGISVGADVGETKAGERVDVVGETTTADEIVVGEITAACKKGGTVVRKKLMVREIFKRHLLSIDLLLLVSVLLRYLLVFVNVTSALRR